MNELPWQFTNTRSPAWIYSMTSSKIPDIFSVATSRIFFVWMDKLGGGWGGGLITRSGGSWNEPWEDSKGKSHPDKLRICVIRNLKAIKKKKKREK